MLWLKWTEKTSIEHSISAPHRTFSITDHILDNKANHNRYKKQTNKQTNKKTGRTPCMSSDQHGLKLEFNSNTNSRNPINTWKLNNAYLNHQ